MIKKLLESIAYSNIIVSLGAGCLYLTTGFSLKSNISLIHFFFICSATFLTYTFMRISPFLKKYQKYQISDSAQWIRHNKLIVWLLSICSFLTLMWSCLFFDQYDLIWSAIMFILCALYQGIIFKKINLRKIPFLKNIFISLVWTLMSFAYYKEPFLANAQLLISNFLFIFILCFPFDLMESDIDQEAGIKTLAHITKTYLARFLLINLLCGLYFFISSKDLLFEVIFILAINTSIYPFKKQLSLLNFILIDGLIILHFFFKV